MTKDEGTSVPVGWAGSDPADLGDPAVRVSPRQEGGLPGTPTGWGWPGGLAEPGTEEVSPGRGDEGEATGTVTLVDGTVIGHTPTPAPHRTVEQHDSTRSEGAVSRETDDQLPAPSAALTGADVLAPPVSRETQKQPASPPAAAADGYVETTAAVSRETARHAGSTPLPRPTNTRILTVANQKGGVGKTTTTVNIAAALALAGLRVLVVDLDPQGNASTALGVEHHPEVPSVYEVLVDGKPLSEVIQECPDVPGLMVAPATVDLAGAEIELVAMVAREMRLRKALERYLDERAGNESSRIDYVLVDCPPSLGLLTVNALVAAREVFIPIQCEYYALEGVSQLLNSVDLIRSHLNEDLVVSTLLLTMYDARTRLSAQVADEVRSHFSAEVLRASIPRSVRISEAPSHGQTVLTYDPLSSGALSYNDAAAELARRGVQH